MRTLLLACFLLLPLTSCTGLHEEARGVFRLPSRPTQIIVNPDLTVLVDHEVRTDLVGDADDMGGME